MKKIITLSFCIIAIMAFSISIVAQDYTKKLSRAKKEFNNPTIIATPGVAVTSSLSESFEYPTFPPTGWSSLSPDGGTGWTRLTAGTSPFPGWTGGTVTTPPGGGNAVAYATYTTGGAINNDQWLVTPQITNVQAGDPLSFWMWFPNSSFADSVDVLISTTGTTPADFNVIVDQFYFPVGSTDTSWTQYTYTLTDFVIAGSNIYIAWREHVADNLNDGAIVCLDLVEVGPPCPIDAAFKPAPFDGATDVDINLASLFWVNGLGADSVCVFFGEAGSAALVYDGPPVNSYAVPGPLSYSTTYEWWIVGKNDNCSVDGPLWSFTTMADPNIVCAFMDDFNDSTATAGWWSAVTWGDACDWGWYSSGTWPSITPLFPATASGGFVGASSDACGGVMNAYLNGNFSVDASLYQTVWIEFDSDFEVYQTPVPPDTVAVDVSIDGGATWTRVFLRQDDAPAEHAVVDLSSLAGLQGDIQFRLCYYGDFSWHWALDNFAVYLDGFVPVELTSFTANVNKRNVILNWSTATETNNHGFEVQKSTNGSEFVVTGFVEGNGTTTEMKNYSFTDTDLEVGTYSYRLKQVDYDGTFDYSKVVEVEVLAPRVFALEQNYPNPFNPATKIKFSLPADSKVSLKIFDVLGQEVSTLVNGNLAAGLHTVNFNASNLNSGIYFYRIDATGVDGTNFSSIKKMILMK